MSKITILMLLSSLLLSFLSSPTNAQINPTINKSKTDQIDSNITITPVLIPPFSANYTVLHKSDPVGTATRQLNYLDDGTIRYHYETEVEWFIFSQKRSETSMVNVENDHVTPQHYHYTRTGTGRDKSYEWTYNAKKDTAKDIKKNREISVDFSQNIQDKLSYHLQHRLNLISNPEKKRFSYPVISTSGSIKDYVYQYDGEEELMLPYGLITALRFKREIKEKKRITYAWFAPDLNYLLVKLYQIKAGTEQFEAQLTGVEELSTNH
ncbi:MAG: DUF3108 domain-containing protein [Colwellia sp.]